MRKIRWSNAEKELLFNALVWVFETEPTMSSERALQTAQKHLPEPRRAKINYPRLKTYEPTIERARERAKELAKPLPEPVPLPEPAMSLETTIGKALVALVDQICAMVIERMQTPTTSTSTPSMDLAAARANVLERAQLATTTQSNDRQRVLIVGLMGAQIGYVRDRYRGRPLEPVFMTADEAKSQSVNRGCPIVLMTKFISHAVQTRAQQSSQRVLYCNGGVDECSKIIDDILKGAKS